MVAELDDGQRREHAVWVHRQAAVLQREDVTSDKQEVAAGLHGDKATPRDVNTMCVAEMLHCGAGCCLELRGGRVFQGRG